MIKGVKLGSPVLVNNLRATIPHDDVIATASWIGNSVLSRTHYSKGSHNSSTFELWSKGNDIVNMTISLFTAVLLVQIVIYVVNAVGAKAINELVTVPLKLEKRMC